MTAAGSPLNLIRKLQLGDSVGLFRENVLDHKEVSIFGPVGMTIKLQISILDKREQMPQYSPKFQCNVMSSFLFM